MYRLKYSAVYGVAEKGINAAFFHLLLAHRSKILKYSQIHTTIRPSRLNIKKNDGLIDLLLI